MASVPIEGIDKGAPQGALDAHLKGDKLQVPKQFADLFRSNGVRTAEDLISYLEYFPTGAADLLQWSSSEVTDAVVELKAELREHERGHGTIAQPWSDPPMGAMNPDDLP